KFENNPNYTLEDLAIAWKSYANNKTNTYRNKTRFVIDELLSFVPGAFLSAAVSNFTYIGAPSQELCLVMPFVMLPNCLSLSDSLQDITIYMILGLTFCVIYGNILKKIFNQLKSLGSGSTFGYEKVVYWRDISSGMSAIPYFSTKVIADIPRLI
ncbi:9072_t:CDS:2, partial [Entrophospora sp. SA101]